MSRGLGAIAVSGLLVLAGCGDDDDSSATAGTGSEAGQDACVGVVAAGDRVDDAGLPDGFCAWHWAVDLGQPRGIIVDGNGDVLVLARADGAVVLLHDDDADGVSGDGERVMLASESGLSHGLALDGSYLYASSATTVYRWDYAGDRAPLGDAEVVIDGMPGDGHSTRTLVFDNAFLYLSVGSESNVDGDSSRSRIRRFAVADLGGTAIDFSDGEVFADGVRNEVGLAFDSSGRLWGVENGLDNLQRSDFDPADIHQDNPAEELNLFAEPGRFYGYPYCWSEFSLPPGQGMGPGTQWADPNFIDDGTHTDQWCRDPDNVVAPVLAMQGHSAPLDVLFYAGGSFPGDYVGDAFVTFHGSWNRDDPTGYKVIRIPFGSDGTPNGDPQPLLEYAGDGDFAADWPHRPVGLATLPSGVLLVTSDSSGSVLAIGYAT
jgi:glucose/arabinose dehydrogenase